jgi:RND family efflux transporter MFP subunit
MSSLEIEVDVNEAYINRVQPEQPVTATLDAYPDWLIPSRVIAIIPTADRQKATVKVRIGFDQLDQRILPDMGVKVAFQAGDQEGGSRLGLVVPRAAVRSDNGRDVVFVIANGRAERRAVALDRVTEEEAVVLSGVVAGERVILEGSADLADGDEVEEVSK